MKNKLSEVCNLFAEDPLLGCLILGEYGVESPNVTVIDHKHDRLNRMIEDCQYLWSRKSKLLKVDGKDNIDVISLSSDINICIPQSLAEL